MSRPTLTRHQPGPQPSGFDVLEAQRASGQLTNEMYRRVPWLDGQLLDVETNATTGRLTVGISFQAGVPKRIGHRLDHPYRGFWVVRDFGSAAQALRETASDDRTVTLVSATDCKVFLWVW
ncbi:MAG TPA: hypothetical protein VFU97_24475 [Xanthobacteraceae bacterium]|nr:hypothetical protein [Xanthobacteraceae bacterium]